MNLYPKIKIKIINIIVAITIITVLAIGILVYMGRGSEVSGEYLILEEDIKRNKIDDLIKDTKVVKINITDTKNEESLELENYGWDKEDLELLDQGETQEEDGDNTLLEIYKDMEKELDKNGADLSRELNERLTLSNNAELKAGNTLKDVELKRKEKAIVEKMIEERRNDIFKKMVLAEIDRREKERERNRQMQIAMSQGSGLSPMDRDKEVSLIAKAMDLGNTDNKLFNLLPKYLGKPYIWGGDDNTTKGVGYDCSGFTLSVMNKFNKTIPRVSAMQFQKGTPINVSELQQGDLVFFDTQNGFIVGRDKPTKVTHVGLYIGKGLMVHASSGSNRIRTEKVFSNYFAPRYMGARRY